MAVVFIQEIMSKINITARVEYMLALEPGKTIKDVFTDRRPIDMSWVDGSREFEIKSRRIRQQALLFDQINNKHDLRSIIHPKQHNSPVREQQGIAGDIGTGETEAE